MLGADGFIGSRVVRAALGASAHVTALCVKEAWRLTGVESTRLEIVPVPAGRWWSPEGLAACGTRLAGAHALVLLAYSPPPRSDRERRHHELAVNTAGAAAAAALAARAGARVVFASSADVYGAWHERPIREDDEPAPATPYARAKLEAERLVAERTGGTAVSARIGTVYGPGENGPRAIPSFVRALAAGRRPVLHGAGADVRDYVHVDDVAAALVNACVRSQEGLPGVVNVGSGEGRSTLEVLRAVERALGVESEPDLVPSTRPPSRLVLSVERARAVLGFSPRTDFDRALAEEAHWLLTSRA